MKWIIIILIGIMTMEIANAQLSVTLSGVKLQTADDYLELNITKPFKFTDITSVVGGYEKRNETYYPYVSFKVLNKDFWFEKVNVTDLVNCTSSGEDITLDCKELNYTINRTKKLHFTLGFNRDITEEYIEGWDWHNVNLGKEWSFDGDFRCYYSNYTSIGKFEARNTGQRQIDIDVDFNFTGVKINDTVRCEDPIYNVKKFYDEFADLSQWNNDVMNDWKSVSGVACAGVGCTGSTACDAKGSNMSINYDIDLSDCVNDTAYVNWTASESGTSDVEDCLNRSYSLDSGATWTKGTGVFCDDLTATTSYGFKIPNTTYSSQFRWRFHCQNFQAAGEAVNIQMFNITCNATKAVVSNCGNLNAGNVQYDLRTNVSSTGTCFNVLANNNTLDCHGYKINYSTTSSSSYGVDATNNNDTTIRSCNIFEGATTGNDKQSIRFRSASLSYSPIFGGSVFNNSIQTYTAVSYGIYVLTNVFKMNITNNKFLINSTLGIIFFTNVSNSTIMYNNITILSNSNAVVFQGSLSNPNNFNIICYNNITTYAIGLSIFLNNNNNTFCYNNIISKNNTEVDGGMNLRASSNNTFIGNVVNATSRGIRINGTGLPYLMSNNIFINNTFLPCSIGCSADILITANSTNNIFLNNSFNKSKVIFVPRSPENPVEKNNITVKWYLTINISNNTKTIVGAQYNINDSNANNIVNESMTDTIKTIEVTEYTQNGSVPWGTSDSCASVRNNINITCFSPYNVSANMTGYNSNATSIEMNRSRLINIFLGIITGGAPDPCAYVSGDWNILCSDNCNILTEVIGNIGKTMSITGNSGSFIANALIRGFSAYKFLATNCNIVFNKGIG